MADVEKKSETKVETKTITFYCRHGKFRTYYGPKEKQKAIQFQGGLFNTDDPQAIELLRKEPQLFVEMKPEKK